MSEQRRGFHRTAPILLKRGWLPVPLPEGRKKSPPEGFTGKKEEALALASDQKAWAAAIKPYLEDAQYANWNTGIRLPANVMALDVDEYRTEDGKVKHGWENLAALAESVGLDHPSDSLPPTIRVTARGVRGHSGQLFFKIPGDAEAVDAIMHKLPGDAVPGVEILRPWHRYTIEAGSLHPEGGIYQAYDQRQGIGRRALTKGFGSVDPDGLPELPAGWLSALMAIRPDVARASSDESSASRTDAHEALEAWLDEFNMDVDDLTREQAMSLLTVGARRAVMKFDDPVLNNSNVSTSCIRLIATLMEDVAGDGELPLREVIGIAKDLYVKRGNKHDRPGEFDRALIWAFPNAKRAVMGKSTGTVFDWADEVIDDDFWGQTSVLRSCRDFARSRLVSPDAMLACSLVVVSSWLPPHLVLPGLVGGVAGLNFYVAIAGASGGGKSAAMKAAKAWLSVHPHEDSDLSTDEPYTTTVATAQGLVQSYTVSFPKPKSEQTRPGEIDHVQVRRSVRFEVDEIGALGAAMSAEGSMLKDFIKTMWTGSGVGTTAAEATRIRKLEDHEFRMTIVAGVQPSTADVILSGHGDGFPQRWLWVEAYDEAPLSQEAWEESTLNPPEPLGWKVPLAAHPLAIQSGNSSGTKKKLANAFTTPGASDKSLHVVEITKSFRTKVYQAAAGSARRIGDIDVSMSDVLDGHSVLLQEKLAALLAALHGDIDITDRYEAIAERITARSEATRAAILQERQQDSIKRMENEARNQGRAEALAAGVRANAEIETLSAEVTEALLERGGQLTLSGLRRMVRLARFGAPAQQLEVLESLPGVIVEGQNIKIDLGGE